MIIAAVVRWRRRRRREEEGKRGFGVAEEAEPPLGYEGHSGRRRWKTVENLDHELIT